MDRRFHQVDVFSSEPFGGNPVAVVHDADGLPVETMQRFANWTNLSETTFILAPTRPAADYRVRIFDPSSELPFAGHPTLGTCHAWLEAGGRPRSEDRIVQECGAGLVEIRTTPDGLAFAAPPLQRAGEVDEELVRRSAAMLRIERAAIVDAQWAANGPNWIALLLPTAEAVLAVQPGIVALDLGIAGPYPSGSPIGWEVRTFFPKDGATAEDPVTGSFNAALAAWLVRSGRATLPYTARQGTVLGRSGRVHLSDDETGTIWVAGETRTRVVGIVTL